MDAVLSIFQSLGINVSLFIQLGLFVVIFYLLKHLVFTPFFAAYEDRESMTYGNEELAEKLNAQSLELESIYQNKARELNEEIKSLFDQSRTEVQKESEELFKKARQEAKEKIDKSRAEIMASYNAAKNELSKEIPDIADSIASQLTSRGASH